MSEGAEFPLLEAVMGDAAANEQAEQTDVDMQHNIRLWRAVLKKGES